MWERDHKDTPPSDQEVSLFVALKPDRFDSAEMYQAANKLCSDVHVNGTRRPSEILHVTLLPIGSCRGRIPSELLEPMKAALGMVRFPAFDLTFDHAMSFSSSKVNAPFVAVGSDGLADAVALHLAVKCALLVRGFRIPQTYRCTPHMTLQYGQQRCPATKVPPFSWRAHNFQLIESWIGKTKHIELGRWPLHERAA